MRQPRKTGKKAMLTASMFFKWAACPHWLYFDRFGDPKKMLKQSAFTEQLLEQGLIHEENVLKGLAYVEVKGRGNAARAKKTLELMKKGVDRIYHGVLMAGNMVGEPDLLERRNDESSRLGSYHYVAVDIKSAEKLADSHRYQLVFYGELLKQIQGVRPKEGYIWNGEGIRIGFPLREFELQFHEALREIAHLLEGNLPPPHLASGCKQSPWFEECKALAKKTNDIALIYNVKKKTLAALREYGIRTLDAAAAMDPHRVFKDVPHASLHTLERIRLQARSLLEKNHCIRKPIALPDEKYEIFFDIEGDPLRQVEYLFGFMIRDKGSEHYVYQLAKEPEDESRMWAQFLTWIEQLPPRYAVYHYGTYEMSKLTTLERRHGGSTALDIFRERMIDLNEIVKDCVVFPLYFYGIKDIGKYIGFERSKKISGGGESVAFYEEWLKKKNPKTMDAILQYNEDDVVATRFLKDWLQAEAAKAAA